MQVSNPNNIKIYNLSAGRSLPEWLSDKRRRKLQKNDVDIRRRIELLQDFSMPHVSNLVKTTPDGQYVIATGTYKPRIRVYDTNQMSMKYEKFFDSHAVQFTCLENDYSKLVVLQDDRHIEFHARYGRFYRTRIPKYGRDMSYHFPSCDMYLAACGNEIYRLNLEQGKFLNSLKTNSIETLCCEFNPLHQLFTCGTAHGQVECWDPRTRFRVGILDCALASYQGDNITEVPKVTSIKYRDGLTLGVGTSTGLVLLYDIRANKPFLVKDHNYELPIKSIRFHDREDVVISMDKRVVKMWDRNTGKAYTHIEPEDTSLNDLCVIPDTGVLFLANEAPKVLSYYVPSLGPAPKWCSFLDNITEELEETQSPQVYDDYKFVTREELDEMNLAQLIGTSLLRAYMHGFFMDVRLYKKAKSVAEPFAFEDYRKKKIKQKIDADRKSRVPKKSKLPPVNKELAQKITELDSEGDNLLKDDRFSSLFNDPEYAIDKDSSEYKQLHHNIAKVEAKSQKNKSKLAEKFTEVGDGNAESSQTVKKRKLDSKDPVKLDDDIQDGSRPKFYEAQEGDSLKDLDKPKIRNRKSKLSLEERMAEYRTDEVIVHKSGFGAKEITFTTNYGKKTKQRREEAEKHHKERSKIRRSAGSITKHKIQPMWKVNQ